MLPAAGPLCGGNPRQRRTADAPPASSIARIAPPRLVHRGIGPFGALLGGPFGALLGGALGAALGLRVALLVIGLARLAAFPIFLRSPLPHIREVPSQEPRPVPS
ncbi:MAG TPA: hypothetical protein VHG53_04890 [Candidatus Limnocylindria bacterium]|nr:hypothetical protein [Candidatus Limnocylindria bacterium]